MYVLSTIMVPKETGLYQAVGNNATCKTQGFFLQLGLTSGTFNMFLSLYFLLVVNFNWKEVKFKKYRLWFNAGAVALGLALAFSGIPFYGPQLTNCYVLQPPIAKVGYFRKWFVDPALVLSFARIFYPYLDVLYSTHLLGNGCDDCEHRCDLIRRRKR
jgi:hypothetical protein